MLLYVSFWEGFPHSVVVYPKSTEDVVKIVDVARKYRMPVIPYSGGTSLEGHFAGVRNPLSSLAKRHVNIYTIHRSFYLCSGRMAGYVSTCRVWTGLLPFMVCPLPSTFRVPCPKTRSLSPSTDGYAEEDSDLVCQPGVGWMEINETLKEMGIPLFFPVRAES